MALGSNALEPLALPAQGVAARVAVAALDVDAWSALFAGGDAAGKRKAASTPQFDLGPDYLPNTVQLQARDISWSGHALHGVSLKATHDGPVWRAQIEAAEFAGLLEYRQAATALAPKDRANAGRLYARLSRLTLGASAAQEVDSLLDEQPISIPALDVVVEDFELQGKNSAGWSLKRSTKALASLAIPSASGCSSALTSARPRPCSTPAVRGGCSRQRPVRPLPCRRTLCAIDAARSLTSSSTSKTLVMCWPVLA